jgi:hypothetical protein
MRRNIPSLLFVFLVGSLGAGFAPAQSKYSGPRPAKPDVPYLLHADNLLETEMSEAREQPGKDAITYIISGATSPARTPLAGPLFLFQSDKISPQQLQLYKLEIKGGQREITFSKKKGRTAQPIRLEFRRLEENLYRIEVDESLETGEYSLTPEGSNQVFCFQVY